MARSFTSTDVLVGPSLAIPTPVTVLAWIKAPSGTTPRIVGNGTGNSNLRMDLSSTTSCRFTRIFSPTNGVWTVASGVHGMTLANWNHIAWTHDGTTATPLFYANGVAKTVTVSTAPSGTLTTTAGTIYVGNNSAAAVPFGGSVAHIAIVPRVLTPGEIAQHMLTGFIDGATLLYPLWGDTTEPDLSGARNNIVTTTGTTITAGPPTLPRLFPLLLPRRTYVVAAGGATVALVATAYAQPRVTVALPVIRDVSASARGRTTDQVALIRAAALVATMRSRTHVASTAQTGALALLIATAIARSLGQTATPIARGLTATGRTRAAGQAAPTTTRLLIAAAFCRVQAQDALIRAIAIAATARARGQSAAALPEVRQLLAAAQAYTRAANVLVALVVANGEVRIAVGAPVQPSLTIGAGRGPRITAVEL